MSSNSVVREITGDVIDLHGPHHNREFHDGFLEHLDDTQKHGIVMLRYGDFMSPPVDRIAIWTNVPHLVTHHSPSGYEWGYSGSGPADLALNVLEYYLQWIGYKGHRIDCFKGNCFDLAWELHQDFKTEFLAGMDKRGGRISWDSVGGFIADATMPDRKDRDLNQEYLDHPRGDNEAAADA